MAGDPEGMSGSGIGRRLTALGKSYGSGVPSLGRVTGVLCEKGRPHVRRYANPPHTVKVLSTADRRQVDAPDPIHNHFELLD